MLTNDWTTVYWCTGCDDGNYSTADGCPVSKEHGGDVGVNYYIQYWIV